jgi:hypothetical protein
VKLDPPNFSSGKSKQPQFEVPPLDSMTIQLELHEIGVGSAFFHVIQPIETAQEKFKRVLGGFAPNPASPFTPVAPQGILVT